jgi:ADP-ribosylglycohydrolase
MVDSRTRANASLVGCSVGDALGALLADPVAVRERRLPPAPWRWTDDTEMACSVFHVLAEHGQAEPGFLADSFVRHHDPDRGYGNGVIALMRSVADGGDLQELAAAAFGGAGSWGNGAAMRVAPLGAWFADDPARAAVEAARSAAVTHTHQEAVAGAVATAVAATGADLAEVLRHTPPSQVRDGLGTAAAMRTASVAEVAAAVGTGRHVSAPDTVPLALWVADRHPDDFAAAIWTAAEEAEDVDTVCAIVGGIVAARVGVDGIPSAWLQATEPLPSWV